jgi:DNA-binding response OmpR family regulator
VAKILIAEDDPLIGSFLEKGLRSNGFTTHLVDDGEQAQRLSLTDEFDLMILDLGLPERDGWQVLKDLRARGKMLPVIVLTGRGERNVVMCLEAGADDYLTKPVRFDELLARVRSRLRGKEELDRVWRIVGGLQMIADARDPGFLRPEQFDLGSFAEDVLAKASALASRRWAIDQAADGWLVADRSRLSEAMLTLAHNAVQRTAEDDTIAIGTSLDDDEARLWVRDASSDPSVYDQAWDFDRSQDDSSTGLGLAVIKAIAEAHGGGVELESRLGMGSTFTIVIPRRPTRKEASG